METKILIVYATDHGNTEKMAVAVSEGITSVKDAEYTLRQASEVQSEDFLSHDGFIFGSPVHMGGPDWRIKKVIDLVCSPLWMKNSLIGKVGAVFVSGGGFGGAGGGCELTLLTMLNNFAELGLILVPLPKNTPGYQDGGLQWGPYGRSLGPNMEGIGVKPESLKSSFHHGANVARIAQALKGHQLFGVEA